MFQFFFIESDGGYALTQAGTIAAYVLAALFVILAAIFIMSRMEKKHFPTKQLVFCALLLALSYAASYIQLFSLPYGGSVTLCSMLFICYVGYVYGLGAGLTTAFSYSLLQFLQNPWILSPLQVCLDYLFAFTALGLSGLFSGKKHGLVIGYLFAIFWRGFFNMLAGYVFWMDYMPESFPKVIAWAYPIVYNYGFVLVEGILTVILISVPAVSAALQRVKRMAVSE